MSTTMRYWHRYKVPTNPVCFVYYIVKVDTCRRSFDTGFIADRPVHKAFTVVRQKNQPINSRASILHSHLTYN